MNTEPSSALRPPSSALRPPSSGLRPPSSALRPQVSICLPTLNARRFLEPRMASILAQTLPDWELIVCDSYSGDGTWEYLQQFKGDPRVRLHQVPKEGLYAGWNECLKRCQGRYIHIASADDCEEPAFLETLVALLDAHSDSQMACCDFQPIDEHGCAVEMPSRNGFYEILGPWGKVAHHRSGLAEFLLICLLGPTWFSANAMLFRRSLLDTVGFFPTDKAFGARADGAWNLRLCLHTDILWIPDRLASWRIWGGQATPKQITPEVILSGIRAFEYAFDYCEDLIPESWKGIPGWRELMLHNGRMAFLDSFHLYGDVARRNPGKFLHGFWRALWQEPGYLWQQCRRGFAWDERLSPDRVVRTRELMPTFNAPWPPIAIS